jgi:dipeptidyl aminopeptidase/acylaminoacyl peptidase
LLYLATDSDGSGPWLHTLDVDHPSSQRVDSGVNRYTSLAASADGGRLVASLSSSRSSLWRLPVVDAPASASAAAQIPLTTGSGFAPRVGANYLLYLSTSGAASGIWKLANDAVTELWSTTDGRIVGGPEIAPHGDRVAFCVAQHGRTLLYVMDADGTNARVVTQSLELRGDPAWSPDGQSLTASANVKGAPQLFRISLTGSASPFVDDYAVDPAWSPGGDFLVYSGADVGTTFPLKAVTAASKPYEIPALTLTRGSRRLRFLHGGRALVVMRGDLRHKDLWLIDLTTGAERQLTRLPHDFDIRDFDVSPDGREIVLERVQEHSDIVLIDLARHG